jgi:hypothetical protein
MGYLHNVVPHRSQVWTGSYNGGHPDNVHDENIGTLVSYSAGGQGGSGANEMKAQYLFSKRTIWSVRFGLIALHNEANGSGSITLKVLLRINGVWQTTTGEFPYYLSTGGQNTVYGETDKTEVGPWHNVDGIEIYNYVYSNGGSGGGPNDWTMYHQIFELMAFEVAGHRAIII